MCCYNAAVSKSINEIKTSKKFPNSKIIVTGCASQIDKTKFSSLPNVTKIVDNKLKTEVKSYILCDEKPNSKYKFPIFNNFISTRTRATFRYNKVVTTDVHLHYPYGRGDAVSLPVGEVNKD